MANIPITKTQSNDTISSFRIHSNDNFDVIKELIQKILNVLDTDTNILNNVNGITIQSSNPDVVKIINNGSENIYGNLSVSGNVSFLNNFSVKNIEVTGNFNNNNVLSTTSIGGKVNLNGSIAYGSITSTIIASSVDAYSNPSGNIGILNVSNKSIISLNFTNYDSGSDTNNIVSVRLPSTDAVAGQILDIFTIRGSSTGTHILYPTVSESTANIYGLSPTNAIDLRSGSIDPTCVSLIFDGSKWRIRSLFQATIINV